MPIVEEALLQAKGNVNEAARLLGITRAVLERLMKRLKLAEDET